MQKFLHSSPGLFICTQKKLHNTSLIYQKHRKINDQINAHKVITIKSVFIVKIKPQV